MKRPSLAQVAYEEYNLIAQPAADPWEKAHPEVKRAWRVAVKQAILAFLQRSAETLDGK